ncbi:hypothetical protein FRC17_004633, partial [Serendipita sp. 399]
MYTTNRTRDSNHGTPKSPTSRPKETETNCIHQSADDMDENDDNKITPKAYTTHVPAGVMRYQPTVVDPANLLTNLLPAKTPRKALRPKIAAVGQHSAANVVHTSHSPESPAPSAFESLAADLWQQLPKGSSTTSSLAPSVKFSSNPSHYSGVHSRGDTWVLNASANIHSSVDFSPTEHTDLVLLPSDRNVEFHVNSSIIFSASSVLSNLIAPILEFHGTKVKDVLAEENVLDVFSLPETYDILDAVLRFIHPKMRQPRVRSLAHLKDLLVVCKKYKITGGLHNLSVVIAQFAMMTASGTMDGSPLDCYALA